MVMLTRQNSVDIGQSLVGLDTPFGDFNFFYRPPGWSMVMTRPLIVGEVLPMVIMTVVLSFVAVTVCVVLFQLTSAPIAVKMSRSGTITLPFMLCGGMSKVRR